MAGDSGTPFEPYLVRESTGLGLARILAGVLCGLMCFLMAAFVGGMWNRCCQQLFKEGAWPSLLWFGPTFVCTLFAFFLGTVALRCLARRGETRLRKDHRAPVLYLRSFGADQRVLESGWDVALYLLGRPVKNYERSLAKGVADTGPLVAIGRPRERLPPLGAARMYASDADWKKTVGELVAVAQLIILRLGGTKGLLWELEHLMEHCDPCKVLLYLPKRDRRHWYAHFRERMATILPHPLPKNPGPALFIGFRPDWEPRLLVPEGPSLRARVRHYFLASRAPAVREALLPALAQLNLQSRRLPLQFPEWLAIGLVPTCLLLMALSLYYNYSLTHAQTQTLERSRPAATETQAEKGRELE